MHLRPSRSHVGLLALAASAAVAVVAVPGVASASIIDVGGQAGVARRNLSDTNYKTGFAWELHGELAMLPPILMVGPYFGMQTLEPDTAVSFKKITFRTIGAHAKLKIPLPGGIRPYGLVGIGWVHGDFPDLVVDLPTVAGITPDKTAVCVSPASPNPTKSACNIPSATANFVEFKFGAGLMIQLGDFVALNFEGTWRPTTGYKNDTYENALQGQVGQQSKPTNQLPPPERNGYSFTGMAGLQLTL